ncbi:UNVERIFIED_CONTAM: hypothetical protein BEN50_10180 [Euhalothece sp. KZN 001]
MIAKATILEWLELVLGFFASPNLLSEMLLLELVLGFALAPPNLLSEMLLLELVLGFALAPPNLLSAFYF